VLKGNLAPEGCVAKISGHERLEQRGPARVFESEEDAMTAVTSKKIRSGDVVVIRNEGPKRRAGHARNAERDRCSRRRGIGILSCAIDRRPLQRRDPRIDGRDTSRRKPRWAARSPPCATAT